MAKLQRALRPHLLLALIPLAALGASALVSHQPPSVLSTQQSAVSLPKDCAIVATVAASRLAPTGVWTRIIFVTFLNPADGKKYCHALTVWQPATSKIVCIYDANGTFDLATESHEPAAIAAAYAQLARVLILEAHFI